MVSLCATDPQSSSKPLRVLWHRPGKTRLGNPHEGAAPKGATGGREEVEFRRKGGRQNSTFSRPLVGNKIQKILDFEAETASSLPETHHKRWGGSPHLV